ncbi:MAG: M20/M25/M40 family metallo-hydrolase [Lachnospiraceae bacterium]|nr:M20/M25/M40 family metallo-hydrolase [Lachnospiraceae bacterium]
MINEKRIVDEFRELVAIDSPSYGERAMADRLKEKLTALGFTVSEDDAGAHYKGNAGNLYGFLKGTLSGEPLLFSSHMDTVEPSCGKKAVLREDGRITSAGDTVLGSDDLAGIVEILEAVRHLQEEGILHRDIEILFPIAEEVFCKGAAVADYTKIRAKEAYVLDISGAPGAASLQEPTHISFDITITGRAAHAGFNPEDGVHAIAAAARAIAKTAQGRIDAETTVNLGVIEGGRATNIVPAHCTVKGEIRCYSHERAEKLFAEIQQTFKEQAQGAEVSFTHATNLIAYKVPEDHPVVTRFLDACGTLGLPGTLTRTLGGSDNNHFLRNGITGIVLSCGMNDVHSVTEWTSVSQLTQGAALVAELMRRG